jgi:hypothetical protein
LKAAKNKANQTQSKPILGFRVVPGLAGQSRFFVDLWERIVKLMAKKWQ